MAKKDREKSPKQRLERRSVSHSADLANADAAASLEVIARGLREGRLVVQGEDEILEVAVPPQLEIEVRAKSSRGARRTSLELSLTWKSRKAAEPAEASEEVAQADEAQPVETELPPEPEQPAEPESTPSEPTWTPE
jgi:amphi-Trp domain-containing protein